MFKAGAIALVIISILHLVMLGLDATEYVGHWLDGGLWTWEHWRPVARQSEELVKSGFAFWSTIGSAAVPMLLLGLFALWCDRRAMPQPRLVFAGFFAWSLLLLLLMPTSGFFAVALAGAALVWGEPRGGWA
ncbi:hypothetical protein IHQ71_13595 [Rhizobium sp. TH2]|uniref:DUF6463 family protein n=1 Tax=Rhizobium sp. TH2 TaxID=2775403 RepID=UPI0021571A43|nr:DUF6463 family protein [Rhizobium sp. TH2]UVC11515.1 hypothetical protein IHQ71_13595 [Rhizobium sp. TH2]